MTHSKWLQAMFFMFLIPLSGGLGNHGNLSYIFPLPNSQWISAKTTLIVKTSPEKIHQAISATRFFEVTGSQSGLCSGKVIASDDQTTCIFQPDPPFQPGENVNVRLKTSLWGERDIDYAFQVAQYEINPLKKQTVKPERAIWRFSQNPDYEEPVRSPRIINGVAVPNDFPPFAFDNYATTAPGKLFISTTFLDSKISGPYLLILNNDGSPYFFKRGPSYYTADFKLQPTGVLSAYFYEDAKYVVFDRQYATIDTFQCGNGYTATNHEFLLMPNGHAFLIGYKQAIVNLSEKIPNGREKTPVLAMAFQELDTQKNVILEWRTLDHVNVEDAVHENLLSGTVDYSHLNSIAFDYDGHLLISQKCQSEVSKIDRQTGEFIWRLGGVNNQFEFINESVPICYQHHFRPVPGKPDYYTLFDNGNKRDPQYSRAVEYKIDPQKMTAEKVWEYTFPPDGIYTEMMGSVQILPNGNRLIDACGFPPYYYACELSPEGELLQEITNPALTSYRTKRFEWEGVAAVPDLFLEADNEKVILGMNKFGDTQVDHYNIYHGLSDPPTSLFAASEEPLFEIRTLENQTRHYFRITAVNQEGMESLPSDIESVDVDFYTLGSNMILNHKFVNDDHWSLECLDNAEATGTIENGFYHIQIKNPGDRTKQIQFIQNQLKIEQKARYILEFDGYSDQGRSIEARIEKSVYPNTAYGRQTLRLYPDQKHLSFEFEMKKDTDPEARISFYCGKYIEDIYLDNIMLREVLITNVKNNLQVPETYAIHPNYPNPFNTITTIRYTVGSPGPVKLLIFNVCGQTIRALRNEHPNPGQYRIQWDGLNDAGIQMGSGVYFATLQSGEGRYSIKIILLK
ncbi:aryl-sulfate sulfotransferase [bacterium]|nr:aryl-sulfate sulfotransferase [bacterium]